MVSAAETALITEQPIPQLGLKLTEKIWQAIYHADRDEGLYQHLHPAQEEFLAAANKYLTDVTRF